MDKIVFGNFDIKDSKYWIADPVNVYQNTGSLTFIF